MSVAPAQELVDVRFMALSQWCTSQSVLWDKPLSLIPLAAEAGFRRYFRIEGVDGLTCSLLAVDANPLTEDTAQFVSVGRFLRDSRVHTPRVFAADADQGFLLVEDFGDNLLFRQLREDPDPAVANTLYSEALMTLLTLQQSPDNPDLIPRYDQALLRRELDIFTEWFLGALLNYDIDAARHRLLTGLFELLEQSALEQPTVLVHRDFHSRNLLTCSDHSLGVIDFQGALWGPCTYDVVSLLRDCYLRWPESDVERWALGFANLSSAQSRQSKRLQIPGWHHPVDLPPQSGCREIIDCS